MIGGREAELQSVSLQYRIERSENMKPDVQHILCNDRNSASQGLTIAACLARRAMDCPVNPGAGPRVRGCRRFRRS
jgi:hypothetical protein